MNPHHYGATFRGKGAGGDASAHAKAIVEKAAEIGVSVLAITDHNNVGGVSAFRSAAANRGIHVFPGFELSSSEGVHVLCIYPQDTDDERLGRFLGEFGITNTTPSSDLSNKSFVEILGKVREQGGVSIAAHIANDKGLFKVLSGKPRIQAWQSEDLRLLPIAERAKQLFGEDGAQAVAVRLEQDAAIGTNPLQGMLFPEMQQTAAPKIRGRGRGKRGSAEVSDESLASAREATTLDRIHAAMLLQAGGRTNALRALLKAEQERGADFLRLANALSALYPKGSEEKRLLDAMLLAVPR
ncbi:MAG: PHP domain-containing protein [Pseudomonadota bacterium]|nr:PHP domain-containing protein [Pseudomonadota bacterium]